MYPNYWTTRRLQYRGSSVCRICKDRKLRNGSREVVATLGDVVYIIPEGYLHYLEAHAVRPDSRLMAALKIVVHGSTFARTWTQVTT